MQADAEVCAILEQLEAAGYEAVLVGGCVRDSLRGECPHDWDIATAALPEQVIGCFAGEQVVPTGLAHGTVTLVRAGVPYEITTYRVDGGYSDGRHPDAVLFLGRLEEDLARRDFTINAMAWSRARGIIDRYGGRADLEAGVVRAVGDARQRFEEDALRMLRAVRFASVLGFTIEQETATALRACRLLLERIAPERIWRELERLLCGAGAASVLAAYAELFFVFWPELADMRGFAQQNPYHDRDVWAHTLAAVGACAPILPLRLAALLHDAGKPRCFSQDTQGVGHFYGHAQESARLAGELLERLRCPGAIRAQTVRLIQRHDLPLKPDARCIRRRLAQMGEEDLRLLLALERADVMGQVLAVQAARLSQLEEAERTVERLLAERACFSMRTLAVDGWDVIEAGVAPGPEVGRVLRGLLELVISERVENEREQLLEVVRRSMV